jgi:ABC-type nickel/cobalt efflux system permease component RcnA
MATAASIGFIHTLFGPDHYLPFIVMSRSGKWSLSKTMIITILCGIGHVLGSVILGIIGIVLGIAVANLEVVESARGGLAAWMLIAFGLVYFVWGIRRAMRNKPHHHTHMHQDGMMHTHEHRHSDEHLHIHNKSSKKNITPWILFTIFLLGPCEPLIPLLMYPAAKEDFFGLVLVTSIFGLVTILTMLIIVLISSYSINLIPTSKIERYMHAIAGATIFLSGLAIQFLGL